MAKVRMSQVYKGFSGSEVLRAGEIGVDQEAGIIKIGDGVSAWSQLDDKHTYYSKKQIRDLLANSLGYLLVTNQQDFIQAVLESTLKTKPKKVVARDITFDQNLGNENSFLNFQEELVEIEFDNCQWFCDWYLQGDENHKKVSIKRLNISKDNNEKALLHAKEYTIKLKNLSKIEDCSLTYQEIIPTNGSYGHSLTFENFNVATNCQATAFIFGEQVCNCWVSRELSKCANCCNLTSIDLLDGENRRIPVVIADCERIINFHGPYETYGANEPLEIWTRRVMPETITEEQYNTKKGDGALEERAYIIVPNGTE